jgi:hypothetical protein
MFLQKLFRSAANVPAAAISPTRPEQQLPAQEFLERVHLRLREIDPVLEVTKGKLGGIIYFDNFCLLVKSNDRPPLLGLNRVKNGACDAAVMDFYTHEFNVDVVVHRLLKCVQARKEEDALIAEEPALINSIVRELYVWQADLLAGKVTAFKAAILSLKDWLNSHGPLLEVLTDSPADGLSLNFKLKNWPNRVWCFDPRQEKDDNYKVIQLGRYGMDEKKQVLNSYYIDTGLDYLKKKVLEAMREHIANNQFSERGCFLNSLPIGLDLMHKKLTDSGCTVRPLYENGRLDKLLVECDPNTLVVTANPTNSLFFFASFMYPDPVEWKAELREPEIDAFVKKVASWNPMTEIFKDLKKNGLKVQRPNHATLALGTSAPIDLLIITTDHLRLSGPGLDGGFQNFLNKPASVPKICSIIKAMVSKVDHIGEGLWNWKFRSSF